MFKKPSGMPEKLWQIFYQQTLIPYFNKHSVRLQRGLVHSDIVYLTQALDNIIQQYGMSGLGAEQSPQPAQTTPWYQSLISAVAQAAPSVAKTITEYRLGKEALKVGAPSPAAAAPLPIITAAPSETPWMTYLLIAGVLLGGFFLARRYKYI